MRPLLAVDCDPDNIKFPIFASPKLDGVRAMVIDGVVVSRNFKAIPNKYVQRLFGNKKYNGLDGELIVGHMCADDVYRKTQSGVSTINGEPDVKLWLFDCFNSPDTPFYDRFFRLKGYDWLHDEMRIVPHELVKSDEELLALESKWLGFGYEGVMLRNKDGKYKFGRSTLKEGILLKLKRFSDSEAKIVGFEELMRNNNEKEKDNLGLAKRSSKKAGMVGGGVLGAFVVQDISTGIEFNIGTGFNSDQRMEYWDNQEKLKGQIVKYRYFGIGIKDAPRFPVFHGFRDELDL